MSRAIDRQIAEMMGYIVGESGVIVDGWLMKELPKFSEDWNAMRLLVEWLQGKGYEVAIEHRHDGVLVELYDGWNPVVQGEAETAPLALCRAVIALKEVLN